MFAFFRPPKCESTERLDGKTIIITGCNTGIGKRNAADFYKRGAKVLMACRSLERAEEAKRDILEESKDIQKCGSLIVKHLDLASMESVRACAKEILQEEQKIDILINNAGVMMCPKTFSKDGIEMQLATNHLGHFLFTLLLLPTIIRSAPSRIVNVSSTAHKWADTDFDDHNYEKMNYSPHRAYGRSKLANILFTKELAKRLEGRGVTVYAVHPGVVKTELGRHMDDIYFKGFSTVLHATCGWMFRTPEQGAQTTMYCSVDPQTANQSGLYYANCRVAEPSGDAKDAALAKKLWDISWKLVKLADFNPFA